ncbi:unnamed protein product [Blepharisma stoltei]|uniref:Protein SYS1 homolog n=1 Tax=Blepharisma stoltei TaxID=1481888 RepID=A0AAU9IPX3_9CILI|nr:unnamed protein product [Blepharisma stoltei]
MSQGRLFGSDVFDPKFIIIQILSLQAIYYSSSCAFTVLFDQLLGLNIHISQIFSTSVLNLQDAYSLASVLACILVSFILIISIVLIVERASKCLDFGSTILILHVVCVTFYEGFPTNLIWWGLNLVAFFVIVIVSEFLCIKIEQKEISLTWIDKKNEKKQALP